ncbi:ABC-2 type transport system ATP-binding protein [Actinacidiphila yanglinensis]|uniref:ABC-2 type transport system ATP-binding protein n=1 Tax=Actinacidiphila yanglinensis TaxID=310779 RepID=A0A1H6DY88_9ACTN|nr:ABC transporter ATP-binding protein [Actinacidiphila yanglinensis]SEG89575.1 ABC-2 type transport system ATP-binding protein [Actinacidiphila yanglinensis]
MSTTSGAAGAPPAGSDPPALEARGLGIRNRDGWALRSCDFRVPRGAVAGLVGPNGDGKSSLLAVAAGLRAPTEGTLRVLGHRPGTSPVLPRVALLLQDRPLHAAFTVAETLRYGREMNPAWDDATARSVVAGADVPLRAKVGHLSGGQRTCVALALALGKRPDVLLLDEPMADLDPLRRHAMMAALMTVNAEHGTTVVMSSHILAELDLVCDYVLLLAHGRMLVADDVEFVQAAHTLVTHTLDGQDPPGSGAAYGRRTGAAEGDPGGSLPDELLGHTVVEARTTGRQLTAMIQLPTSLDGAGAAEPPTLEEILLAYLRNPEAPPLLAPADEPAAGATARPLLPRGQDAESDR